MQKTEVLIVSICIFMAKFLALVFSFE